MPKYFVIVSNIFNSLIIFVLPIFSFYSCSQEKISATTYNFERSGSLEFVCYCTDEGNQRNPYPMEMCKSEEENTDCYPFAFVLQINRDELGLVDIKSGLMVDSDLRVPFVTFAQTGKSPSDIAVSPDGSKIFVTHFGDNFLAVFNTADFGNDFLPVYKKIPLPGPSSSISINASLNKIFVSLPSQSALAILNLNNLNAEPEIFYFSQILKDGGEENGEGEIGEFDESEENISDEEADIDEIRDGYSDGEIYESEDENIETADAETEGDLNGGGEDDGLGGEVDASENEGFSFVPWVVKVQDTGFNTVLLVSGSGEDGGVMIFDPQRLNEGLDSALISMVLRGIPVSKFAVTPDGNFLYAIDREEGTIHVVNMATGLEVDTSGGNPLIPRGAIKFDSDARDVTIEELDFGESSDPYTLKGIFGFAVTSNGSLYIVDIRDDNCTGDCPQHVLRNSRSLEESYPVWLERPIVIVDENQIQYTDLASLNSSGGYPVPDPAKVSYSPQGASGRTYYMYGVSFFPYDPWLNDPDAGPFPDIRRAVTQRWRISYEDTIPYSDGIGGNIEDGGVLSDTGIPFCAIGVRSGDILVIDDSPIPMDDSVDCSSFSEDGDMEYRITEAFQNRLIFEPHSNNEGKTYPLPSESCFPFAIKYHIHASGEWLVTGGITGFLNDWSVDAEGRCIDAKPPCTSWTEENCTLLNGRAREGRAFVNPYIKFVMVPGSRPTPSGMTFFYDAGSAFKPISLVVGKLPHSLKYLPWNKKLYVTDEATEGLVEIDLEHILVSRTFY